ncbi:MAG: 2-oxoacid:acceptor oxidoreductase subunit alpha, partial [Gammaproteobacteria bacterium]
RIASRPVQGLGDRFDVLAAIDWMNVQRFLPEMPLDGKSLVIYDPGAGEVPEAVAATGARAVPIAFKELAGQHSGGRTNMVALGVLAQLTGLPLTPLEGILRDLLGRKGEEVIESSLACFESGRSVAEGLSLPSFEVLSESPGQRWFLSGNEAAALGALQGGIRFVAAYPITPASDLLEWMTPRLEALGGCLVQAEDELASINMAIGASYGGVPSLTATSGPGLSLMSEGLGLAIASETPVVVVNVMRGGPSTGIPTKSEQSDLDIALHGMHGDAPHVVLAPSSMDDCVLTTRWAARLAESLQTAVIVLTDQAMGQARAILDPLPSFECAGDRAVVEPGDDLYQRYAETDSGVSPVALPGARGGAHTADGLEHEPSGKPSTVARDHKAQLDKRERKLTGYDYGWRWGRVEGEGDMGIITWGSSALAVSEARDTLERQGARVKLIVPRLLSPLPLVELRSVLSGVERLLVVEQSHSRQFLRHLRAHLDLPDEVRVLAEPGPLPLRPARILEEIESWI